MTKNLRETKKDHNNRSLPKGIYALVKPDNTIASYKARWREEDANGISKNAARSFSVRKLGGADKALRAAEAHRAQAVRITQQGGAVPKKDPSATMTIGELFSDWCIKRGANLSQRYAEDTVKRWDNHIATRSISRVQLGRISLDPTILTRFQDELQEAQITPANQAQLLKTLRAVLRWGRRRYPTALTIDFSGLFEIPSQKTRRLAFATDAYGLERLIEAVANRPCRDPLLPIRDAALVAAMSFTIAARPSEWLYSATWNDLQDGAIELQRPSELDENEPIGLKTGARAALVLDNAKKRLDTYESALSQRFGKPPKNALIFQAINQTGLIWLKNGKKKPTPKAWTYDDYKRWTARVWRPARLHAATAPDAPHGLDTMRFYDCRHTAISMALHSTLVISPHGMNLHNLAAWAGHDVQTLQRYYSHIIARYQKSQPITLEEECREAHERVAREPHPR